MEFFVFLLFCAFAALAVYSNKTRRELTELRNAVSALIGELRSRGMDDIVDGAKHRAGNSASQSSNYVDAIRDSSRRRANVIDPPTRQAEPEESAAQDADKDFTSAPTRITEPEMAPEMAKVTADEKLSEAAEEPEPAAPEPKPEPEPYHAPEPAIPLAQRFENLIGGKLPIWIGAIALIFAGFFLVKFSIEAGWMTPGVRVVMAAIFGVALLAASEAGRIWPIFDDDKRLGQAFAGAGIAILYGTLYMAAELYGLVGLTMAFVLVVIITAAALFLSLKHGAPTAIMGLLGGFAAPYVAGLGADSAGPLLIYLAVFTGGLFALSIHRGWLWLSMLATGGSVLWSSVLMVIGVGSAAPFLGLFVAVLAIAGMLALGRILGSEGGAETGTKADGDTGTKAGFIPTRPMLRIVPLALGLLQLAIFAPLIEFTALGWMFYAALSVFALVMAWRDYTLTPAALGALILALVMFTTIGGPFERSVTVTELIGYGLPLALLFGVPGQIFAFRENDGRLWSLMAILAPTGVFAVSFLTWPQPDSLDVINGGPLFSSFEWGLFAVVSAIPSMLLAWRASQRGDAASTNIIASAAVGLLLLVPAFLWPLVDYLLSAVLLIGVALAYWGLFSKVNTIRYMPLVPIALAAILWWVNQIRPPNILFSVTGSGAASWQIIAAYAVTPAALMAAITHASADTKLRALMHWGAFGLAVIAVIAAVPYDWHSTAFAVLTLIALAPQLARAIPPYGWLVLAALTVLHILSGMGSFARILVESIIGEPYHYQNLPDMGRAFTALLAPGIVLAATWWLRGRMQEETGAHENVNRVVMPVLASVIGAIMLSIIYWLFKQPLAIDTAAEFVQRGFAERVILTQLLFAGGYLLLRPVAADGFMAKLASPRLKIAGIAMLVIGVLRFVWFDMGLHNPLFVEQNIGSLPLLNLAVLHLGAIAMWIWLLARLPVLEGARNILRAVSLVFVLIATFAAVRQAMWGSVIAGSSIGTTENYLYSATLLVLAIIWLWRGIASGSALLRIAGLLALTLASTKVFLVDIFALGGILRILSLLGFAVAAIGIGWFYSRIMGKQAAEKRNEVPGEA